VARVRIRRHQRRGDALVAHAHALERTIGGERLTPDRQVRLAVHRCLVGDRQDVAAVGVLVDEARDVAVAARDRVAGVELEDLGVERAGFVAGELGGDAKERDGELGRRREEVRGDAGHRAAGDERGVDLRELRCAGAEVLEGEVAERLDRGEPAFAEPLREQLVELL